MLNIAVISGGSTYTPESVKGFLARVNEFPLDELWLMDIDQEQLQIVSSFAQRMIGQETTNVVARLPATSNARRKLTTKEVSRFCNS